MNESEEIGAGVRLLNEATTAPDNAARFMEAMLRLDGRHLISTAHWHVWRPVPNIGRAQSNDAQRALHESRVEHERGHAVTVGLRFLVLLDLRHLTNEGLQNLGAGKTLVKEDFQCDRWFDAADRVILQIGERNGLLKDTPAPPSA